MGLASCDQNSMLKNTNGLTIFQKGKLNSLNSQGNSSKKDY